MNPRDMHLRNGCIGAISWNSSYYPRLEHFKDPFEVLRFAQNDVNKN